MNSRLRFAMVLLGILLALPRCAQGQVYEEIFSFADARAADFATKGSVPAGVVQSSDGNFYGTTGEGGAFDAGTVYRMTSDGMLTTLVEFTGNGTTNKGETPSTLVQGNDGNFYGTTGIGGASDFGTVFRITPGGMLTTLVEFTGNGGTNKGRYPFAGLVLGNDGNLYGTTRNGGTSDAGTIFRMTPAGALTTVVNFSNSGATGSLPQAALIQASDGNLYGTTVGGTNGAGTVFKMTLAGVLTHLAAFPGVSANDPGGVVEGIDGNFYGTTRFGGTSQNGTIFKMTPAGVVTTLVTFTGNGATNKGRYPTGVLAMGTDGDFYGTTAGGGASNLGTAFKMTPAGSLTTLVAFSGNATMNKGSSPASGLMLASNGSFYGTTGSGGSHGKGTVFKMSSVGVLTTLVELTGIGGNRGSEPQSALLQTSDGNFHGTTGYGGASDLGTIFTMTSAGTVTTRAEFVGFAGSSPVGRLAQGSDGSLYGTAGIGGAANDGTVFKIAPNGVLTTILSFGEIGTSHIGRFPNGLCLGSDGNFYGTTQGAAASFGTVFKVTPAGTLTTLVEFTTTAMGTVPKAGLLLGNDLNFYGTTSTGGASNFGTVFRMTPAGVRTTLVSFSNNGATNKGSAPVASLMQDTDLNFYGTTSAGGTSSLGTVFKMTPAGAITTLVSFTGNGATNKGSSPVAGLVKGVDGNFYGTTLSGGATGFGTIFKMTPGGVLTTLVEFATAESGSPRADMIRGADGNLYGTTSGPDGSVYRLVFTGNPLVAVEPNATPGSGSVVVEAKINARGAPTTVTLEYGTDGVNFTDPPNPVPVASNLNGFQTRLVGTTLQNLAQGTTYYYRFRAQSSAGVTYSPPLTSPPLSFSTLAEPVVVAVAASPIAPNSARFNGTVNARNFDTTVLFEWGTDGNSFPNVEDATPLTVTGNSDVAVFVDVAGLVKGSEYFYRIVATNVAGTVVSGTQSFRTLTEPVAAVTGAFGLSTTSARVFGTVDARGSDAGVVFEFGVDGVDEDQSGNPTFPSSVAADPAVVPGAGDVVVAATLTNLSQGTTYHFRIRATSDGGVGVSAVGTFSLGVLSGFTQTLPAVLDPRAGAQGFLVVNLSPSGIGEAWRFVGEQAWRVAGVPAGGLATGNRQIEFRPVPGFLHPLREPVSVVSGAAATVVDREYFAGGGSASGSLSVTLLPAALGASAQWRLLGEGDGAWRASGASLGGLAAGVYLVECKDVDGFATPRPRSVSIGAGEAKTATATYFLADAPVGAQPGVVGFDAVSAEGNENALRFVGQLRSDSGAGTGFVVRPRVVCTAAHVVFDDGTLSPATGLQWLFQRERGTYEPVPQIPRGSYILTGYAAQRAADNSPGTSSAAAQNLDVASVWFFEQDAARGGAGGYLASDSLDNEWLLSPRLKTIVGYPLDDTAAANQGRIHATPPMNVAFAHANGRVYLTDDITSRGGNSGGPVMVQYDDGAYFPAAVYLGGTTQTRVRAIDGDVITLFDSAEESSNTGQNSTNGGIAQINNASAGTPSGTLSVTLEPAEARTAGAGWRIGSGAFAGSGQSRPFLSAGSYTVTLKSIPGFQTPTARNVSVTGGNTTSITVTYATTQPPIVTGPAAKSLVRGVPVAFSIQATNSPDSFAVSGLAGTGLTLNPSTGQLSGTPQTNGTFTLTVTATNGAGTSAPFTITLTVADPGILIVQSDPTRGSVKIKPRAAGNIFAQGTAVTLAAKPAGSDFIFAGWQFSGLAGPPSSTSAATTNFTMTESVMVTANFIVNPYLLRLGNYSGLLRSPSGADGLATLTLGKSGAFTLKLALPTGSASLTAALDGNGDYTGKIKRKKGLTPIEVTLHLDTAATEPALTGTITADGIDYDLTALRAVFSKTNPASEAGKHTLLLPPDPAQSDASLYPAGHGYALLSIGSNGSVKATGQLGDGTPFAGKTSILADHTAPLHIQPYQRKGILAGTLTFIPHPEPDIDEITAPLRWQKPAPSNGKGIYALGFTGTTAAYGARYTPPAKGTAALDITDWELLIGAGVLGTPITATATLDARNRFTLTPADAATLKLNPTTGQLSGTFKPDSAAKPVKFTGALLQRQRTGAGTFKLPDRTGPVQLDEP